MMETRKYIDSLFDEYEESLALKDFKEELQSNLDARIKNLTDKGMPEKEAFHKATEELKNISDIADEISLKKKKEIYEDMYMSTRAYMTPLRVFLYISCGAVAAFGVIVALLSWFYIGTPEAFVGTLMPFIVFSVAGFTCLGLTQETATYEPMRVKRAVWYGAAVSIITFGTTVFFLTYFTAGPGGAIATLFPFVLPGAALSVFLCLTEKDRRKSWVKAQQAASDRERFSNPARTKQYGLVSGALWIFAFAVFAILTGTIGLHLSWITFVVAVGAQFLVQFFMALCQ